MARRLFPLAPWFSLAVLGVACPNSTGAEAEPGVLFERKIRPLLARHCFTCHGEKRQDGGLRLDLRARALLGGDHGPVLAPGRPSESSLLARLTTEDGTKRMPLGSAPLPPADLLTFKTWIAQGAHWPDRLAGKDRSSEHWAFRPPRPPRLPKTEERSGSGPIDWLVRANLRRQGIAPATAAPPATQIRRLYLDLVGLPPRPADLERWQARLGRESTAYADLVDELLKTPQFGERWGRHWLDLARFGESDGYENDRLRSEAWRFRDWVVDAHQRDLPFDQFTVEQLAGDLLDRPTPAQRVATGFHRNTLWNSAASADKEEFRTYAVKDRVDTTGQVWMGLTVGCAKCHTHKYDPITQKEYYQLYAFFNATDDDDVELSGGRAPALKSVSRDTRVHLRGLFLSPGEAVRPGTPAFLPPLRPRGEGADRLDLARWLVRDDHPLTARAAVNQIWMHLFGDPLVTTPENFGLSGAPPALPELLDWLALEFRRLGWSRKALIRTIVLSDTYRQSSHARPELDEVDPTNRWLARQHRVRVEAEVARDLALSVSGLLDLTVGGPSVVPPFPSGLLEQRFTSEHLKLPGGNRHRRSLYIHVQRTLQHPLLSALDAPDGNQACLRRDRGVTPIQSLTRLNDPNYLECATALGQRLLREEPADPHRIRLAFRLCLSRDPTPAEQKVLDGLVSSQRRADATEAQVWTGVARTLLNLEEFITRE